MKLAILMHTACSYQLQLMCLYNALSFCIYDYSSELDANLQYLMSVFHVNVLFYQMVLHTIITIALQQGVHDGITRNKIKKLKMNQKA